MEMNLIDLKKVFKSLSYSDKKELLEILESSDQDSDIRQHLEEARFSNGISCHKCGNSTSIVRYGKNCSGLQRYKCKECGAIFTAATNTIFNKTQKPLSVWEKYIGCMQDGKSIAKSAEICDISIPTSFVWRHKILDALSQMKEEKNIKLKGVIESESTFFSSKL